MTCKRPSGLLGVSISGFKLDEIRGAEQIFLRF